MSNNYHCPRCKSPIVKKRDRSVFCVKCELHFDKMFLKFLEDEDILADEELEGILKAFDEDSDNNNNLELIL